MGPWEDACPGLDSRSPWPDRQRPRARLAGPLPGRDWPPGPLPGPKPRAKPGDIVVFAEPLRFRDGVLLDRLQAIRHPTRPRQIVFRAETGRLYRVPRLGAYAYHMEPGPTGRAAAS